MNNIIQYAKKAGEAFKNYISNNDNVDYEYCQRISGFVNNIENLSEEQSKELTDFINANTFDIVHLADVYTIDDSRYSLETRLKRMNPFKVSKPPYRIHEAKGKGDFSKLISIENEPIKVRKLKKFNPKTSK